jgi:hypothetical protein
MMERDWKWSLLQPDTRRARELHDLDARQLQDVGLKRNDIGQIVLAADPTRLVLPVRRRSVVSIVAEQAHRIARWVIGGARAGSL